MNSSCLVAEREMTQKLSQGFEEADVKGGERNFQECLLDRYALFNPRKNIFFVHPPLADQFVDIIK